MKALALMALGSLRAPPLVERLLWELGTCVLIYLAYRAGLLVAWFCRDHGYLVFVVSALPVCVILYFLMLQWLNLKKETHDETGTV